MELSRLKPGLAGEGLSGSWHVWFLCFMLPLVASNPSASPPTKSYSFGRQFLGLDKCNACVGTSICKKFFKEEIRFEKWLSSQLDLPSANRTSYEGNYTCDSESWRPVVLSRLVSPHLHELADKNICMSAGRRKSCSIEAVLRATPRFQTWTRSNLLLPSMVQALASPMLRCPSQRLLDRIVRRYFEVADVGSVQMKHFTTKDKLRLLYTMAVNQQPLILQMFPGTEGWPFLRYHGSCGRLMVWAGSGPLKKLYSSPLAQRADAAYQLLHITQSLACNSLRFHLYYTTASEDMFGIVEDGRVFITDASTIGIIDLQEGEELFFYSWILIAILLELDICYIVTLYFQTWDTLCTSEIVGKNVAKCLILPVFPPVGLMHQLHTTGWHCSELTHRDIVYFIITFIH
uniref:Divergent protein kinase domain 2B n=1 Tax=Astyanax mexicanus TaxID=7994 RepID=A0A8B9J914_ASTMX